ncbi:MAG: O-antigen ligase family protein [Endozoicomonas sp.]
MLQATERGNKIRTGDAVCTFLHGRLIPFGFFVFMTGQLWLPNNSSHISQTYIWLMLPTLLLLLFYGKMCFKGYRCNQLDVTFLGFLLLSVVSFFWSDTSADFGRYYKDGLYILLFVTSIGVMIRSPRSNFPVLLEVAAIVAAIGALVSIYYHFFVDLRPLEYRYQRIFKMGPAGYGDFGNPILSALFFGVFALILYFRISSLSCSGLWRGVLLVCLLVIQLYLTLTWSRGPLIALACAYTVIWCFQRNGMAAGTFVLLFLVSFVVTNMAEVIVLEPAQSSVTEAHLPYREVSVSTAAFGISDIPESLPDIGAVEQWLNESMNARGTIWVNTAARISESPWFGHGIGAALNVPFNNGLQIADHPHSLYLQIAFETGLAGLFLFLSIVYFAARTCWQFRADPLIQMAAGLFVFGLVGFVSDVSTIIVKPDPFWMLFWLPLGMVIGVRWREQAGMIGLPSTWRKKGEAESLVIETVNEEKACSQ